MAPPSRQGARLKPCPCLSRGAPARTAPATASLRRFGAAGAAALALWAPGPAHATERLEVQAQRRGDVVEVRARAEIQAPRELVWSTLTDYERMPEFIPGMKSSRVISRDGPRVTVAQSGEARFLFFSTPLDIVVESDETPPHLDVKLVSGNLRALQGRYEFATSGDDPASTSLRWMGSLAPEVQVPDWIGTALVRHMIEKQFSGMVKEIERREALRRAASRSATP